MATTNDDGAGRAQQVSLDEDELWAVFTALCASVEMLATTTEEVNLVMDLQEEALDLVRGVFKRSPR